ncbi:MAG TPA: M6 family metalloprotease domain-containing protein [Longimicrobium sp.]|nr:M6 family metalloprotease domain-containing protein [Longimicrobium sp.]
MSARALFRAAPAAVALAALAAAPAAAQDVRVQAHLSGKRLPAAFERRLAENPAFFEVQGWRAARRVDGEMRGTLPLVVLQGLFADSPEPQFTTQQVQQVIFDGPSPGGTLPDFYTEVSAGRFRVDGDVRPWVRTTVPREGAVDFETGNPVLFFLQTLQGADASTDFGLYDNDGPDGVPNSGDDDGRVDAAAFHYIEKAASCDGPGIWPHRSRVSNWPRPDGSQPGPYRTDDLRPNGTPIVVDDYITQSTVDCAGQLLNIAVITHELGHVLGLPDLYDALGSITPDNRRWVVGCWTLMAAGAWGCGDGAAWTHAARPPHMGAWEKAQLGWAEVLDVGDLAGSTVTLQAVQGSNQVLRIPLRQGEYFLVEYRPNTGWDRDLPAGGLLVHHVDETVPFRPCAGCPRIYGVSLVEADGNGALLKTAAEGGNRGEAGDVFRPGSAFDAAHGAKTNAGDATAISLTGIRLAAGGAEFFLQTVWPLRKLLRWLMNGPGEDLTTAEKTALDKQGNDNDRYDIGDLRAYLLAHPSVAEQEL